MPGENTYNVNDIRLDLFCQLNKRIAPFRGISVPNRSLCVITYPFTCLNILQRSIIQVGIPAKNIEFVTLIIFKFVNQIGYGLYRSTCFKRGVKPWYSDEDLFHWVVLRM